MIINKINEQWVTLPADIKPLLEHKLALFQEKLEQLSIEMPIHEECVASLPKVWACSEFVADSCIRFPVMLKELIESGQLFDSNRRDNYRQQLSELAIDSEQSLMKALRQFRRREMVRIAWRDLAGWADLDETLMDLSILAESCIQFALDYFYQQACSLKGTPMTHEGQPMNIVVLGMGKLGAWELNYSSDIDLIFAFAEEGTLNDRKETSYSEFFTRICRKLVKALDEITVDGFVFRTDIRLRPFGDSGPVIMSFDGMENYFLTQAREWERYAMIKARQVAGDFESGKQLSAMIRPFVYRRYLDYGAFEELRSIKRQITQEVKRKDLVDSVKLGAGGIREVEFIGQAFQLIRGGQDTELQQREIRKILSTLAELQLMDKADADFLLSAYAFLRRTENHIQQYQDKQTHDLPKSESARIVLAYSMGYGNWEQFQTELQRIRDGVHQIFMNVFSLKDDEENTMQAAHHIWENNLDDEALIEYLREYGFENSAASLLVIQNFKDSHAMKRMTVKGLAIMDSLMPKFIEALTAVKNKDETLKRLVELFESVAGRNVYLSLLAENPDALDQLVKLTAASHWICDYLAHYPILFDELLDTRTLYEPLEKEPLRRRLQFELSKVDELDMERLMIVLRQYKHAQVLKVAAADIMEVIPVTIVSDYLTYIAEVVLEHTIQRAWLMLADKHGTPPGAEDDPSKGFAILGLGKLGGLELGYGSDLDMVFVYECSNPNAMSNGAKPISAVQFYQRLGQKIRHILDTKLLSGVLYEVDLRLRPSGDSGLLVAQIDSYEDYLRDNAWTWEHQALVRGRFITGDPQLQEKFEGIRSRILSQPRDKKALQQEVREMRQKMRDAHAPKDQSVFDLKQSKGGIADIEFIVQFAVLANAAQNTALAKYTDNARLLESLAANGYLTQEDADILTRAYYLYRSYGHRQVLQGQKAVLDSDQFDCTKPEIERLWDQYMESEL